MKVERIKKKFTSFFIPRRSLYYSNIVKVERRKNEFIRFFIPRRSLYYPNIVKVERRKNEFIRFFIPRRILYYPNIVKAERRRQRKSPYFVLPCRRASAARIGRGAAGGGVHKTMQKVLIPLPSTGRVGTPYAIPHIRVSFSYNVSNTFQRATKLFMPLARFPAICREFGIKSREIQGNTLRQAAPNMLQHIIQTREPERTPLHSVNGEFYTMIINELQNQDFRGVPKVASLSPLFS